MRPQHNKLSVFATIVTFLIPIVWSLSATVQPAFGQTSAGSSVDAKKRKFMFTYAVTLKGIEPRKTVKIWLPVATSNHDQTVKFVDLNHQNFQRTTEKKYGNALIYFEAAADDAGEVPILAHYLIERNELTIANLESAESVELDAFLAASRLVPTSDQLRKIVVAAAPQSPSLHSNNTKALQMARQLYDGIDNHMKYNKPVDVAGWGKGDAVWACDSRFGNCTDFHSLFISCARNLNIPSKFEIGFSIPADQTSGKIGGYHCWAKFLADQTWLPVDISEADKHPELKDYYFGNLTADRVMFSTGRDLELVPANQAGPVNFLVYPYAEVDGKQHTNLVKQFQFEDVNQ